MNYTILYYTILYYTILYYTILYYTLRSFPSLWRRSTRGSDIDQRPLTCEDGGPWSLTYAKQTSQCKLVGISVLRIIYERVLAKIDITIVHLLNKHFISNLI